MRAALEPPTQYGPRIAQLTLVGWGSTYGPLREAVDILNSRRPGAANMVHFHAVWPLALGAAEPALMKAKRVIVVEVNTTGQLAMVLRSHVGIEVAGSIRRYDGRAFTPQYILRRVQEGA